MGVSDFYSNTVFGKSCEIGDYSSCILTFILTFGVVAYGIIPVIVIAADVWSAFRKGKHWIPAENLVLGALALQFLAILKISFDFSDYGTTEYLGDPSLESCELLHDFLSGEIHVLSGRVSVCVLMGCLLPGVARPLSTSLWSDMIALIISSSILLFQISYEAQMLQSVFHHLDHCEIGMREFYLMQLANVIIIVSIVFLVLVLGSAALASVTIPQIVSPRIPIIFSPPNFHTKFGWEKVEEQVTKSWIVVRTSDPQYIINRTSLSSSVALVIGVCNGILVSQLFVLGYPFTSQLLTDYIESVLRWVVIVMVSLVIYWRCITQVVYYPKSLEWSCSSLSQYFQIEDFWKTHLLGLMRSSRGHRQPGRSCLLKIILKLCRVLRLNRLLHVLYWLHMFSVLFSKFCCLLLQLLLSNKYFGKLLMGSAYAEFSNLYRSEIRLGESSDYQKYIRALINMQGENSAGLWMANRKSIGKVKKRMEKGENEGKQCSALISLLTEKSSPDFCGEKCLKPQNDFVNRLEVERELDVRKCSWKMTAISIIAVIIELSAFTHDEAETKLMLKRCIEGCSQAWNIMEVVENNASETVELSIAADGIFQNLEKRHKWLEYSLPLSRSVERSPAAAKEAIQSLVEKGKEIANKYCSNKASEAIAGYSLYRIGRVCINQNHQFNSVGEICDRMCRMLADVMGSCSVKAAGVIMEDCKKLAIEADEESILKIARVAGKVKGMTESVGWTLKWSSDAESTSINTSLARDEAPAVRRYHTFQIG